MGSGVWMLYVLDRILDSVHAHPAQLRERHIFHARHRCAFIFGIALTLPTILVLAFWLTLASVRRDMLLLSLFVAAYLLLIHGRSATAPHRLPKELAVGVIFSAATVVPTWARVPAHHAALAICGTLFAAVCWLNCVAIEHWETPTTMAGPSATSTTQWTGAHLEPVCALLCLLCVAVSIFPATAPGIRPIAACVMLSAAALATLNRFAAPRRPSSARTRTLSPLTLRIAADAALLTPLLVLLWL